MGLIWTLIKEFEIKSLLKALPPQQGPAKDQFLEWVRSKCAPRGITVNNWTTDFQDGRVFLAIINDLRPDLVPDWGAVNGLNPRANLSQAFDLAEDEMDIPQMLDVDDVIRFADDKSIQAYCAEFLNYEQKNTKLIKSLKGALSQAAVPDPRLAQQKADLEARERAMQEQQRKHAELLAQQQQATLALEKMRLDQQKRMLELEQQKQALAAQQAQHAQLRAQQEALQRAHQQASMEKMQRDEILRAQNQAAAEAQLRAQQEQFNQQRLAYEQHVYQQKMLEQQQQQAAAYHHQQQQYAMMQRNLSMPPPGQIVGGPMMGMPIYAAPPPQQAGNIEVIIKGTDVFFSFWVCHLMGIGKRKQ